MLKRLYRLTKKKDFQRLYRNGKKVVAPIFIIKYLPNQKPHSRFGVVVSSKVAKNAYQRNRLKRQITEILRDQFIAQKPGYDIVLVSLQKIKEKSFQEIAQTIQDLFKKANLW